MQYSAVIGAMFSDQDSLIPSVHNLDCWLYPIVFQPWLWVQLPQLLNKEHFDVTRRKWREVKSRQMPRSNPECLVFKWTNSLRAVSCTYEIKNSINMSRDLQTKSCVTQPMYGICAPSEHIVLLLLQFLIMYNHCDTNRLLYSYLGEFFLEFSFNFFVCL